VRFSQELGLGVQGGGPAFSTAFNATLMKIEDSKWILICLIGFYDGAQSTISLGMQSFSLSFVIALILR